MASNDLIHMEDAINAALDWSVKPWGEVFNAIKAAIESRIKQVLAVDAAPVAHGHINIEVINPYDGEDCYCSVCGHGSLLPDYKWCPYCGAKMDDDDNRDYEATVEMQQYCEEYESTYSTEDGSM